MARLLLFNPENDIMLQWPARRSATASITLGAPVEALRRSGALLPAWWAESGDAIMVDEADRAAARRWLDGMADYFPTLGKVAIAGMDGDGSLAGYVGEPWGWSGDAGRRLAAYGAQCPTLEQLERMRQLSHRRTSLQVMRRLKAEVAVPLPPLPVEATSLAEVADAAGGFGSFYLKAPWSSSGRGVARFDSLSLTAVARAESILRRQGSVMVEKALDGVQDFAMLFYARGGMVGWRGYSLFFTERTSYGGNLLMADEAIEDRLVAMGCSRRTLVVLQSALERALAATIGGDYTGWLGIDMLLTRNGLIAPCLEVNLRMTMGVVAHYLTERIVAPGVEALYRVAPCRDPMARRMPVVEGCRLIAGNLSLTPPGSFEFMLTATMAGL